jgi:hypothetical protein
LFDREPWEPFTKKSDRLNHNESMYKIARCGRDV